MAPIFVKRYYVGGTELYGFRIDQRQEEVKIQYIEDNRNYRPAGIDGTTGTFDYGDWGKAFFMKIRPCMLNCDGTVAYYLNPNDYSLREDGSASDIADTAYAGNVMVEFPKSYYKIVDNGDDTANVYVCNQKLDDGFRCWSFIDCNGEEIEYCYMSVYPAQFKSFGEYLYRICSFSGNRQYNTDSLFNDINYARNNGKNCNCEDDWCVAVYCDIVLLQIYSLLIGKSVNSQETFGYGLTYPGKNELQYGVSGTLNAAGLFYGFNLENSKAVNAGSSKFFGMENYIGPYSMKLAGLCVYNGDFKVKMTHGTSDGSAMDGYLDVNNQYSASYRDNYIQTGINSLPAKTDKAIRKMNFSEYGFLYKEGVSYSSNYASTGPEFEKGFCDQIKSGSYDYGLPYVIGRGQEGNNGLLYRKLPGLFYMNIIPKTPDSYDSGSYIYQTRLSCKPRINKGS